MIKSKKLLIIFMFVVFAIYFTGCPIYFSIVPGSQEEEKQEKIKPPDVEEHHYDDRGLEKGKKHPDGTEGQAEPPPKLEKKVPDVMSKYDEAVELDRQGRLDEAYDKYKDFIESIPDLEDEGRVDDPHKKSERERAMEHAKKRMAELARYKQQQQ